MKGKIQENQYRYYSVLKTVDSLSCKHANKPPSKSHKDKGLDFFFSIKLKNMLVSFPCSQNYVQYIFQKPSFYFQLTFFSFPVLDFSLVLVNSNSLGRKVTGEIIYLIWEHPSSSQAGKTGSAAHLEFPSQPVYTTTTLFILTEITGWCNNVKKLGSGDSF